MSEVLPKTDAPATPIVEYTKTAAALAELEERFKGVIFNVTVPTEMTLAREGRRELRTLRTSLEKLRLQLNEEDQERIKARNAEARRITLRISALEDPIDQAIKSEEERCERDKREAEEAEKKRLANAQAAIAAIAQLPGELVGATPAQLEEALELLPGKVVDVDDDFRASADDQARRTKAILESMLESARAREAAAAAEKQRRAEEERRLAEEREAFERERAAAKEREEKGREAREAEEKRRRAELEERERESRERIAREEAQARARREEEEKRVAEEREARVAQERAAEERRRADEAERQAERDRLDAERRELERQRNELMDGAGVLRTFVERFGKRREFATVVKAITEYLGKLQ